MRSFSFVLLLSATVAAVVAASDFNAWASRYGKTYSSPEEVAVRQAIFAANVAVIEAHNADASQTFTMAANFFADLTREEFAARAQGYKPQALRRARPGLVPHKPVAGPLPSSIDWVSKGAVTPVGNEGQCGSCWAFTSVDCVASTSFLAGHKLIELSEQQLMDCSTAQGNQGCNGGLMDDAFEYTITNKGLCTEASYPYTATGPNTCKTCTPVATISSYADVPVNNATALQEAVVLGVVAVAVEADQPAFQYYSTGVITSACGAQISHSLTVVGYGGGENGTPEYWLAKNLWGATWGDHGYVRIGRGKGQGGDDANGGKGMCGILTSVSYAIA